MFIISEDSGIGYEFIKILVGSFCVDAHFETSTGIQSLRDCLELYVTNLDMEYLVFFDNTGSSAVADSIRVINRLCARGLNIRYTYYYSLEEHILMFKDILLWCRRVHPRLVDVHSRMLACIKFDSEYLNDQCLATYVAKYGIRNREKFDKKLLEEITSCGGGRFRFSSKNLGRCWCMDCAKIRKEYHEGCCDGCELGNGLETVTERMRFFLENSPPLFEESLDDIFPPEAGGNHWDASGGIRSLTSFE